jgi:hypothetical protein
MMRSSFFGVRFSEVDKKKRFPNSKTRFPNSELRIPNYEFRTTNSAIRESLNRTILSEIGSRNAEFDKKIRFPIFEFRTTNSAIRESLNRTIVELRHQNSMCSHKELVV